MWPDRYFDKFYFAGRYWPMYPGSGDPEDPGSGMDPLSGEVGLDPIFLGGDFADEETTL
jgi:hypothetical protein